MNSISIIVLFALTLGGNAQYYSPRPASSILSLVMKQTIPKFTPLEPVSNYGYDTEIPRAQTPMPSNPCTEEVMRSSDIFLFANPSDSASYLICTDVDVFISMPCSPGTIFQENLKQCIPIGWEAPLCPANTCKNQGDCYLDEFSLPKCLCRVGFTGQFCEINIDECALEGNRVCSSYNGQCIDQINGFYCQWGNEIGLIWEKRISNPCTLEKLAEERQFFELISDNGNVFLQCTGELTFLVSKCADSLFWHQELRTCSIERPLPKTGICNNYPCKNDGECLDLGGSNFQCLCKSGYTGALCEVTIDFCLNNPCSNNGRCVSHPRGYNCVCQDKVVDDSCATGVTNPCPAGSRDYFPNPLNINRYFLCSVNGFAFSRNCAPGLIWSQDLLTCKSPFEVKAPQHQKPPMRIPMSQPPKIESYGQVKPPMTPPPVESYGQVKPPMTPPPVESYGQITPPRPPMTQQPVTHQSFGHFQPPRLSKQAYGQRTLPF